jgi:hypothetical protein
MFQVLKKFGVIKFIINNIAVSSPIIELFDFKLMFQMSLYVKFFI